MVLVAVASDANIEWIESDGSTKWKVIFIDVLGIL